MKKPNSFQSLFNIVSGRRAHINSVFTPIFNESLYKMKNIILDSNGKVNDRLHRTLKYLLYSSFGLFEYYFGETGKKASYIKVIDEDKARKILRFYFVSYYQSLSKNYRKYINQIPDKNTIINAWANIYDVNPILFKDITHKLSNVDTLGVAAKTYDATLSIILGSSFTKINPENLEETLMFATAFNAFLDTFSATLEQKASNRIPNKKFTLLLSYYFLIDDIPEALKEIGFDVLYAKDQEWDNKIAEFEEVVKESNADAAIELQHGEEFPVRDLLRKYKKLTPVLIAKNYGGSLPENPNELGFAGYLSYPFSIKDLISELIKILPKDKKRMIKNIAMEYIKTTRNN